MNAPNKRSGSDQIRAMNEHVGMTSPFSQLQSQTSFDASKVLLGHDINNISYGINNSMFSMYQ